MRRSFSLNYRRLFQTGILLLILTVVLDCLFAMIFLFGPVADIEELPYVLLLTAPFGIMGFYLMWRHNGEVILTDEALIVRRWGRERSLQYAEIVGVQAKDGHIPPNFTVKGANYSLKFSRFVENFSEIYRSLQARTGSIMYPLNDNSGFPQRIHIQRKFILQNGLYLLGLCALAVGLTLGVANDREDAMQIYIVFGTFWIIIIIGAIIAATMPLQPIAFTLEEDQIIAHYLGGRRRPWLVHNLQSIEMQTQQFTVRKGMVPPVQGVRYPILITFQDGQMIQIAEERAQAFGFTPERLAALLRQLYHK